MALLLLLGAGAHGFVLMPANATGRTAGDLTKLTRFAYRWTMPEDTASNEGLGGGLSWVLDPSFCDKMLSRFPEGHASWVGIQFVTCNDILDAFARGFATWEANHKHVQFRDIGDAAACASSSTELDDSCPWQLYVSTDDGVEYPDLAAYVINSRASAFGGAWWEEAVRSPAGEVDLAVDPLRRSVMRFQTHICWCLSWSKVASTLSTTAPHQPPWAI
jgi:hypothetical protein